MTLTAQTEKDLTQNLDSLDQRIHELAGIPGSGEERGVLMDLRAATAGILGLR